jgi:hypothetical protein
MQKINGAAIMVTAPQGPCCRFQRRIGRHFNNWNRSIDSQTGVLYEMA